MVFRQEASLLEMCGVSSKISYPAVFPLLTVVMSKKSRLSVLVCIFLSVGMRVHSLM